jgi:hypothetical protein
MGSAGAGVHEGSSTGAALGPGAKGSAGAAGGVYAGGAAAGGGAYAGALVAGPTSHACLGATGAWNTGAAGAAAAISSAVGARPERPWGASVRDRAALTLCSMRERREEYIDRFSVDL